MNKKYLKLIIASALTASCAASIADIDCNWKNEHPGLLLRSQSSWPQLSSCTASAACNSGNALTCSTCMHSIRTAQSMADINYYTTCAQKGANTGPSLSTQARQPNNFSAPSAQPIQPANKPTQVSTMNYYNMQQQQNTPKINWY